MKILITGIAGFIGSHVVDKLIEGGHDVSVFDVVPSHRNDVLYQNLDMMDLADLKVKRTGEFEFD